MTIQLTIHRTVDRTMKLMAKTNTTTRIIILILLFQLKKKLALLLYDEQGISCQQHCVCVALGVNLFIFVLGFFSRQYAILIGSNTMTTFTTVNNIHRDTQTNTTNTQQHKV